MSGLTLNIILLFLVGCMFLIFCGVVAIAVLAIGAGAIVAIGAIGMLAIEYSTLYFLLVLYIYCTCLIL